MKYDRDKHHRASIRLKGYDYSSPGAYFVTICTHQRRLFFEDPAIRRLAEACWQAIPDHAPAVVLDEWVVMPNHLHAVIVINADPGRGVQLNAPTTPNARATEASRDPDDPFSTMSPRRNTLSVILRTYKAAVTTACRNAHRPEFAWQRNYYDHIVRNERELNAIRRYIRDNPLRWALDRDNPQNANRLPPPARVEEYLAEIEDPGSD